MVERVRGYGEDRAGGEDPSKDLGVLAHDAGETHSRGGVAAKSLVNAGLQVGNFLGLCSGLADAKARRKGTHVLDLDDTLDAARGKCLVESGDELLVDARVADDKEHNGAGRVGGGVGSGDELSEG